MISYETLKTKPKRILTLTGYALEEFKALVPYFSKRFLASVETKTLAGKYRKKRRYTHYKNSCLPSLEDKLLFILIYLRNAMTQNILAELFGTSQPVANKWIHRLLPVVNRALADLGELPSRETYPATFEKSVAPSTEDQGFKPLFFMMPQNVRFSVQKTLKSKRRITVVKRNSIPSRIIS